MREQLEKIFRNIEDRENIKIIFAVENGSRAWRMDSIDSDYDVRFVYVRPALDYFSINKKPEVIVDSYDKNFDRVPQEGCYIDMEGFDILKYLKMLSSSNPTAIEWLMSDIVYYGSKPQELVDWVTKNFNPVSLYWHYKSMCRQNYEKYIKSRNLLTYKKYLYAMRGLINAKYVSQFDKIPPIDFMITIGDMANDVPQKITETILEVIIKKKLGLEKDIEQIIPEFDYYIENYLNDDSDIPTRKVSRFDKELDNFARNLIKDRITHRMETQLKKHFIWLKNEDVSEVIKFIKVFVEKEIGVDKHEI